MKPIKDPSPKKMVQCIFDELHLAINSMCKDTFIRYVPKELR